MAPSLNLGHFPGCHPEDAEATQEGTWQGGEPENCWHCGTPTPQGCHCADCDVDASRPGATPARRRNRTRRDGPQGRRPWRGAAPAGPVRRCGMTRPAHPVTSPAPARRGEGRCTAAAAQRSPERPASKLPAPGTPSVREPHHVTPTHRRRPVSGLLTGPASGPRARHLPGMRWLRRASAGRLPGVRPALVAATPAWRCRSLPASGTAASGGAGC